MGATFNISLTEDEMKLLYLFSNFSIDCILVLEGSFGYTTQYSDIRRRISELCQKLELEDFKDVS